MTGYDFIPSRDTLAQAVGLARSGNGTSDLFGSIAIFATGVVLGGALALLFALAPGREVRTSIRGRVSDWSDKLASGAEKVAGTAERVARRAGEPRVLTEM